MDAFARMDEVKNNQIKNMTTSRGNPNGPTLDGKELEVVHKYVRGDGRISDHQKCNNGAYNIRWTTENKEVTCPACLKKMGK